MQGKMCHTSMNVYLELRLLRAKRSQRHDLKDVNILETYLMK